MKKLFLILLGMNCIMGFAQSRRPVGTAELTNGGRINIMEIREVASGDRWGSQAPEGNRFIALDILIDNTKGTSDINLNYIHNTIVGCDFELRDGNGYTYLPSSSSFEIVKPAIANDSVIEKGDILRGFITFAILSNASVNDLRLRLKNKNVQSKWTARP